MEVNDKYVVFCYIFSVMGIVTIVQLQQLINLLAADSENFSKRQTAMPHCNKIGKLLPKCKLKNKKRFYIYSLFCFNIMRCTR
ncbi:MAG: hypothetical protein D3907_03465 [Candidatus Electrothrix sp. AUS3]|nr:hypothetical protein [Candidatus Electrothrix gigas]